MSGDAANAFGWRNYARNPPPRPGLLLEMHNGGPKFVARPCELRAAERRDLWWRLTGIAKEQLERGERARMIHGELVVMSPFAVMGAEMIAPGQRNVRRDCER